MIELKNVKRHYTLGGETIRALDGVSLRFEDGSFTSIMGPSGSGKTTFLNLIGGLDQPDNGKVLIDGKDLSRMKDKELSRYRNTEVGFVFQAFHLQPIYTALENVMMPLMFAQVPGQERKRRAAAVLKLVDMDNRMRHRPSELSAGQRQRVSIARAMVNEPKILLADEPTGNLDSKNGKIIMDVLKGLMKEKGVTIVMVTHDELMARFADHVIMIRDGKVHV